MYKQHRGNLCFQGENRRGGEVKVPPPSHVILVLDKATLATKFAKGKKMFKIKTEEIRACSPAITMLSWLGYSPNYFKLATCLIIPFGKENIIYFSYLLIIVNAAHVPFAHLQAHLLPRHLLLTPL